MFVLMISRSGLKLCYLGSETRSPGSKENIVNTSGHSFEAIIMNLAQNVCLDEFKVKFKTGLGSKTRSPGQTKGKYVSILEVTFFNQSS